jgi:hypothetical protein
VAGGFEPGQENMTVQEFVSAYCLGSINRELPGQFYGMTILDVQLIAQTGDAAARRCIKLLNQGRFRK